jgi:hypothetical protein
VASVRTRAVVSRLSPALGIFALITLYLLLDAALMRLCAPGADWAPLWAAGHFAWVDPARAYDFSAVTLHQQPVIGPSTPRPFIYPPTALMLFAPFALLPFYLSLAAFILPSLVLFIRASAKVEAAPSLLVTAPPVMLAIIVGQPTLLVAALLFGALALLPDDENRAGALIGICAVIKPPLLLLAPVALCAGGHWRAIRIAAVSAATLCAASVLLFGLDPWWAWLAALPRFQALVAGFEPLARNAVTPYATAARLGVSTTATMAIAVPIAIAGTVFAFRRSRDLSVRLVALVGGALLVSPYAMDYELAAFAPVIASIRIRGFKDTVVPAVWAGSLFVNASVVGLLAAYGWAAAKLIGEMRQSETMARCLSGSMLPPDRTATVP